MKNLVVILSVALFVSCSSTEKNTKEIREESVEQTDNLSRNIPPHLIEFAEQTVSFPNSVYNSINELKALVSEYEIAGNKPDIHSDYIPKFHKKIENFIHDNEELENNSHPIIIDFCDPFMVILDEIPASQSQEAFEENIRNAKEYLGSFKKLFPQE